MFVGRLSAHTTAWDILEHVLTCLGSDSSEADISVEEITACLRKYGYKGFKMELCADRVADIICAEKWPSHVTC